MVKCGICKSKLVWYPYQGHTLICSNEECKNHFQDLTVRDFPKKSDQEALDLVSGHLRTRTYDRP